MQTSPQCMACAMNQAWRMTEMIELDPPRQAEFLRMVANYIGKTESGGLIAANYTTPIYHMFSEYMGEEDLFAEEKKRQNELALRLIDHVEEAVRNYDFPIEAAIRVSASGNLIDSGVGLPADLEAALIDASRHALAHDESEDFLAELEGEPKRLFFIHDNAGEIVFDRLLIELLKEHYPELIVISCVKAGPIVNDATEEDARVAGIDRVSDAIITSGSNWVGSPLDHVGQDFMDEMKACDLFLAKGQGNYECLDEYAGGYLLLTAKCKAVADALNVPIGKKAMARSGK
ncbi:MAG: damage-control phosphatase ARMT1 family protein [Candidatus Sumerlaeia bacterium]